MERNRLNEELVLAALINGFPLQEILLVVKPENFICSDLSQTFVAMINMVDSGKVINVANCLNERIDISSLLQMGKPISEFKDALIYAKEISDYSKNCKMSSILKKGLLDLESDTPLNDLSLSIMSDIEKIFTQTTVEMPEWNDDIQEYVTEAQLNDRHEQILYTGLHELDSKLCPVTGARLVFIAGRPGDGKTALACQLTAESAKRGKSIAFFTLENTKKQMFEIFLAREFGINRTLLAENNLSEFNRFKESEQLKKFEQYKIHLYSGMTKISDILSTITLLKYKKQIDFAVIDYIGLIEGDQKNNETKTDYLSRISRSLKNLTIRLNMPIVVLAQLNRDCVKNNRRAGLFDLRDCGAFEQDGDVIFMLHRPNDSETIQPHINKLEINAEKNRVGSISSVGEYMFNGRTQTFYDFDTHSVKSVASISKPFGIKNQNYEY